MCNQHIICGDCLNVMAGMPENSIDTVITDPPYGLGDEPDALAMLEAWLKQERYEGNGSGGFMGREWDKFVPGPHYWREVRRVLKPGGMCLVFGGTRTYDLTTLAMRVAGFRIVDTVEWIYAQGFPKSYSVSKGADKQALRAWLDMIDHDLSNSDKRKVVSAAVSGGFEHSTNRRPAHKKGGRGFDKSVGKGPLDFTDGSDILAHLLACHWHPLTDSKRHAVWAEIVGDHEGCDVSVPPGVRVKVGQYQSPEGTTGLNSKTGGGLPGQSGQYEGVPNITIPSTPLAKQYEGYGSALKPAHEPVIVAMNPRDGTFVNNALKWGVSGIWVDGGRIATNGRPKRETAPMRDDVEYSGNSLAGRVDGTLQSSKATGVTTQGRWPANLIIQHHPECVCRGVKRVEGYSINRWDDGAKPFGGGAGHPYSSEKQPDETVADWDCVDGWRVTQPPFQCRHCGQSDPVGDQYPKYKVGEIVNRVGGVEFACRHCGEHMEWEFERVQCPVKMLEEQSGERPSGGRTRTKTNDSAIFGGGHDASLVGRTEGYPDSGTAARFFYTPKASRRERTCDGRVDNDHPTVKPLEIMRYLVRLTKTPTGGVVLDPFVGSGTTLVACLLEGRDGIGIDQSEHACSIAKRRVGYTREDVRQLQLL